jgi:deoxyribodipyrimidine photo-lyase
LTTSSCHHAIFHVAYDAIEWESGTLADEHFNAWCEGHTGYPLVDAAMKQIAQTGYMHNRLRMISASFLVKDLGFDAQGHFIYRYLPTLKKLSKPAIHAPWQARFKILKVANVNLGVDYPYPIID